MIADTAHTWAAVVDRYTPLLWAVARAHGLDPRDSAEVVQLTWLRLLHRPVEEPRQLGEWLAATARTEALRRTEPATLEHASLLHRLPEGPQGLLRLLVVQPSPSDSELAAALGVDVAVVQSTRGECVRRLHQDLRQPS